MGRSQFERVIAAAPRERFVFLDLSSSAPIAAGTSEQIDTFLPLGKVGQVVTLAIGTAPVAPIPGATIGSWSMRIRHTGGYGGYLLANAPYNKKITLDSSTWVDTDPLIVYYPSADALPGSFPNIRFDSSLGFRVRCENGTDAAITGTRIVTVAYMERQVS